VIELHRRVPQNWLDAALLGRIKETAAVDSWRRNGILEKAEFASEINSRRIATAWAAVHVESEKIYWSNFNVLVGRRMIEWE
jgi:hypothetical protein